MISIQPTMFHLTLKDGDPIELTLDECQELCGMLMTILAPTLDETQEKPTEEPPLVPMETTQPIPDLPIHTEMMPTP